MAYQPFAGYVTAYNSSITNAMKEVWDPIIFPTAFRSGDVLKFFQPDYTMWQHGKKRHIRVRDKLLNTARFAGTPLTESGSVGALLVNPMMAPSYAEWQVAHTDLMSINCGVRHAWPTAELADEAVLSNISETLSRESIENVTETMERGLIGNQTGAIGQIKAITDGLENYSVTTDSYTDGQDTARIYLDQGALFFHQGDVIDVISRAAGVAASMRGATVLNVGYSNPASGVFGFIDVDASTHTGTASSWNAIQDLVEASTPSMYVFLSGEYSTSFLPSVPPAATSGAKTMYGVQDWFRSAGGGGLTVRKAGTIYNVDRTSASYQWAVPVIVDKYSSGNTAIAMEYLDDLLMQVHQTRLRDEKVTNMVLLAAPKMVLRLTQLTDSVNRRMDQAGAGEPLVTNYGFEGLMYHSPFTSRPVGVQLVRGMPETMITLIQPKFCELMNPGGIQWLDWGHGNPFMNEQYTSGDKGGLSRTFVYRADRVSLVNSLIRVPKLECGALVGVKPV